MAAFETFPTGEVEVKLDGSLVDIPADRSSFSGIRSYLESLALAQQRIVCSLTLDGEPVNLTQVRNSSKPFSKVEAETMTLNEVPAQLIKAALQQAAAVRSRLQSAVELVLINNHEHARELWWSLATALKEPLLTLSLVPENACSPVNGGASLMQLRKWQLQQLGSVIKDVDAAGDKDDVTLLSDAIEQRALPWLESLCESLNLWQETLLADTRGAAPEPV